LAASACAGDRAPTPPAATAEAAEEEIPTTPLPDGLSHRVREHVAQFGRNWPAFHLHGSVLVARGEEIGVHEAFGQSELVDGVANTPQTRFRLGTLSAPITAVVVLRLAEDGKLALDDTLDRFLPEIAHGRSITVEQLLSHRSGLASFSDMVTFPKYKRQAHAPEETMGFVAGLAPEIEPGSDVWPSNTNYLLLGRSRYRKCTSGATPERRRK
jgi:CubicO group peptidase (beta-lactamase class C family)